MPGNYVLLSLYTIALVLLFTIVYHRHMQTQNSFSYGNDPAQSQGTWFDALYFTVMEHATVGSNIVPNSTSSQALVMVQMMFVIVGTIGVWVLPVERYFPKLSTLP